MKKLLLITIWIYQNFLSSAIKNILGVNKFCRYSPTCSEYAKRSVKEFGIQKGLILSTKRLLQCQPFFGSKVKII